MSLGNHEGISLREADSQTTGDTSHDRILCDSL